MNPIPNEVLGNRRRQSQESRLELRLGLSHELSGTNSAADDGAISGNGVLKRCKDALDTFDEASHNHCF